MNLNRWRNLHQHPALLASFLLAAIVGSNARGQLLVPAILYPPSVTSGVANAGGLIPFSAPTGFSYTGPLKWSNVQTLGATLVMDMEGTLDPNYVAPFGLMNLGAAMSGSFTVPGPNCLCTPPDFVINSFSLTTSIEAAVNYNGPNPYPQAVTTVTGPFHGGVVGVSTLFNPAAVQTPYFPYTYSPNFPIIRLRLTWNVDGTSLPGQFEIDFPASASFTPVPEPGFMTLTTLATSGLLLASRRKKKRG